MAIRLLLWSALTNGAVHAFWRMACDNSLTTERLDPIISPGTVSGHVHNIAGGSNIGASASYASMRESSCTSCPIAEDLSAYWTPQLYYQYQNGSFYSVPGGGTTVYYLQRNGTGDGPITAFPKDFRMVSGNPTLRTYDTTSRAQQAINFVCLNFQSGSASYDALPHVDCPDGLRLQVVFPSCWDGVNLDSADHKSHMAFPSGISSGSCDDPKYPVRLITIFFEIFYSSTYFKNMWHGSSQPFVLAHGDPTGYGFHGDFLNGWDVDVLQKATDTCNDNSGSIDICEAFTVKHPASGNSQCHKSPSVDEIVVNTVLPALPGCNPVTVNTADAITAIGATCSKPLPTLWTNTTGYYGYIVPFGYSDISGVSVLESYKQWDYVGCYQDIDSRIFPTRYAADNVGQCLDLCQTNGFAYGGMEWGQECWCGKSLNTAVMIDHENCAMTCKGNSSQYCGDSMTLTTYALDTSQDSAAKSATESTTAVSSTAAATSTSLASASPLSWQFQGCYTDSWTRTIRHKVESIATVEACQAACSSAGYSIAGLENWTECYCDNLIQSTGSLTATSECNLPCDKNHNEMCGGAWRLSVYFARYSVDQSLASIGSGSVTQSTVSPTELRSISSDPVFTTNIEDLAKATLANTIPNTDSSFSSTTLGTSTTTSPTVAPAAVNRVVEIQTKTRASTTLTRLIAQSTGRSPPSTQSSATKGGLRPPFFIKGRTSTSATSMASSKK